MKNESSKLLDQNQARSEISVSFLWNVVWKERFWLEKSTRETPNIVSNGESKKRSLIGRVIKNDEFYDVDSLSEPGQPYTQTHLRKRPEREKPFSYKSIDIKSLKFWQSEHSRSDARMSNRSGLSANFCWCTKNFTVISFLETWWRSQIDQDNFIFWKFDFHQKAKRLGTFR